MTFCGGRSTLLCFIYLFTWFIGLVNKFETSRTKGACASAGNTSFLSALLALRFSYDTESTDYKLSEFESSGHCPIFSSDPLVGLTLFYFIKSFKNVFEYYFLN